MADKSYVSGDAFSDADVLLFSHLSITRKEPKTALDETSLVNLSRWESHVKNLLSGNLEDASGQPKKLPKDEMKGLKKMYDLS